MTPTNNNSMDSRLLASVLSSLVSQILLTVLLPNPSCPSSPTLFPLITNLLSSSQIATTVALLSSSSKKRKRPDRAELDLLGVPTPCIDPFKVFFRMKSSTFEWLTGLLEPLLECRDPLGSPLNLPAEIRLGIGLFRLGTGSDYSNIADRFNVSESTSRFCTKQLCRVLCTNFRFWIAFPNTNDLELVSRSFQGISGFPNCCGVINCTGFKIGRKNCQGQSVVAQIVVDNSSKILNIVAGFRNGDSGILKASSLCKDVEQGCLLNGSAFDIQGVSVPQYLVGDGSYPLLPWLMVPFVDPVPCSPEEHFNQQVRKMHSSGLKTLASLRNWGILDKPIEEKFKSAVAYIGACSILHNALLSREDYSALSDKIGNHSMCEQCSQYYPEGNMKANASAENASIIRNALVIKLNEVHD